MELGPHFPTPRSVGSLILYPLPELDPGALGPVAWPQFQKSACATGWCGITED